MRYCEVEVTLDQIFRKLEGRSNGLDTQTLHLEGTATLIFIEYHLEAGSNCS